MSRTIVLVCLSIAFSANLQAADRKPLPASDLEAGHLRVVTYNILGGRNTDGTRDLQRVADVIRILNPDLIALQEVDVKTRRINGVDVPAELAKRTGLTSAFAEAMPYDGGSYGEATLTRLKILKQIDHPLPLFPVTNRGSRSNSTANSREAIGRSGSSERTSIICGTTPTAWRR